MTPALWSSIQRALDGSDYFVLLASPEAAGSPWVNREIEHWVTTKSPEKILPVVTDGQWRWDPVHRDFSADSTAVPPALRGVFAEEPLYLDLRWARDDRHLSLRHSRFRDAIAQLAAPMHGVSKDDLEGEDVRQHRRARQLRSGALTTLVVLLVVASLTGVLAVRNAGRANAAAAEALRQQHSALQQRGYAERSAEEARHQQELAEQQQSRAADAAQETRRQMRLAQEQRALAEQASVEAGRQEKLAREQKSVAEQASVQADRQEKLAREQQAAATKSSAEARQQQQNARRMRELANQARARAQEQQRLAQQQRELAQRWAAQARLQEQNARRHELEAQEQQRKAQDAAREAERQERNATRQRTIAVGRRLLNQARTTIEEDPQTALMLGSAADAIQADAESRRELTGLVTSTRYAGVLDGMDSVVFGAGDVVAAHSARDKTTSLWNVTDRGRPVRLATLDGAGWSPTLGFSPDGHVLAVVRDALYQDEGALVLFDVVDPGNPKRLGELPGLTRIAQAAFSPDGGTLIVSSTKLNPPPNGPVFETTVTLWDMADPARPSKLSTLRRGEDVEAFRFSPDGRTVVMAAEDLQVWGVADRANPVLLRTLEQNFQDPVAFSPSAPVLATVAPDKTATVRLWDMSDPREPRQKAELTVGDHTHSLTFRPDGRTLAVGDEGRTVTLWDVADPAKPSTIGSMSGTDKTVRGVAYSRDGRTLATTGLEAVALWNTADYGAPRAVRTLTAEHGRTLTAAFGPGGRSMITAHSDGTAAVWDVSRPEGAVRRATMPIHDGPIQAAAFSLDRRTVATIANRNEVTLTDTTDPDRPATLATIAVPDLAFRPPEGLSIVTFSPDGQTLAGSTDMGKLLLWDLADRAQPRPFPTQLRNMSIGSVQFSSDGRTLAVGDQSNGGVDLLDVTDRAAPVLRGRLAGRRPNSSVGTMPAVLGPDGNLLVAQGSSDRTAMLWDVTDRAAPHRLGTLSGHTGAIQAATPNTDGTMLATRDADGTAIVWDITDREKPLRMATLDTASDASMVFSPDGHTLSTYGSSSAAATLWDYTPLNALRADVARQACAIIGRGLTEDDWNRYIPEIPYRPTCAR